MKTNLEIKNLESQVVECYSYFMNNYQNTNFDALESMVLQLQKSMNLLTMTNIVNIIDRVVEDGRLKDARLFRQYNVNSIQTTKDNKIYAWSSAPSDHAGGIKAQDGFCKTVLSRYI
mgnify:CR=1 FL=1